MHRSDAYKLLADRLNKLRSGGYGTLLPRVGQPVTSESVQVGGELIVIEIEVVWADRTRKALHVRATAYGPSNWKTERLEESFIIGPDS